MKRLVLFLISLYQKTLSFDHGLIGRVFANTRYCRYNPSCSMYTYQAIEKYGVAKGVFLGLRRISTCHPYSTRDTYDPVK